MSADWQDWIGRSAQARDRIDAGLARRFCATLDRALPVDGHAPQGLHWCLAPPDAPTAALGGDGHPARGAHGDRLLPPIDLPRRMWAAGTLDFGAPLTVGADVQRTTRIAAITPKHGSSGVLVFVELAHTLADGDGATLICETQTLVYRAAPSDTPQPPAAPAQFDPQAWDSVRTITPSPVLLMRYSALTFNSHRIHYDQAYATGVEGYPALVVHGPLIASLLLDLAARRFGDNRLRRFAFRAVSPAFVDAPLTLAMRGGDTALELGAFAADGRAVMVADAGI